MKEEFKIERVGDSFKMTQHSEDVRPAAFMMKVYNDITARRANEQRFLDDIPKQMEVREQQIELLDRRLKAIRPHLKNMRVLIKKDEMKAKRIKK